LRAFGVAEFLDSRLAAIDGVGGLARGAGQREGGDEGALGLGGPAVDSLGLARDGLELEAGGDLGIGVKRLWRIVHLRVWSRKERSRKISQREGAAAEG
jgi:hypothetical protein